MDDLVKNYDIKKLIGKNLQNQINLKETFEEHLKRTEGKVITRFHHEPNNYLHIGSYKALRFNFKLASDIGGYTYIRFDDTNPET